MTMRALAPSQQHVAPRLPPRAPRAARRRLGARACAAARPRAAVAAAAAEAPPAAEAGEAPRGRRREGMVVGVPAETAAGEKRVAATPESVKKLVAKVRARAARTLQAWCVCRTHNAAAAPTGRARPALDHVA